MRTAIVYASKHGTTEKVAQKIQKVLGEDKARLFAKDIEAKTII